MFNHQIETIAQILGSKSVSGNQNHDLFAGSLNKPKLHDAYRLNFTDGLNLPHVVVTKAGDMEDFFALIATYYQDKSPITPLVHILGLETSQLLSEIHRFAPSMNEDTKLIRQAFLGAAIGEATIAGLGNLETTNYSSYAACRRTLSFSICRSHVIHNQLLNPDFIASRWAKLRVLTGLSVSSRSIDAVQSIYRLFVESKQDDYLLEQLSKLFKRQDLSLGVIENYLINIYPMIREHTEALSGAFDGRLSAFTKIVNAVQLNSHGIRNDEIAVAYFLNSILPGSYNHTGVLMKLIDFYPSALIWYGLFASLSNLDGENRINPSLMNKLDRDLIEPFSFDDRPKCDISFDELQVLYRSKPRPDLILPSHQRAILVSIAPGVDVYTRYGFEAEPNYEKQTREHEIEEINFKVTNLLEEAIANLKKVTGDRKTISGQFLSSLPVKKRSRKENK